MINKAATIIILLLSSLLTFGQSEDEKQNRLVYNRFEYFFNTQQTDSIYSLMNDNFKKQVPLNELQEVLNIFYRSGKIKEAIPVTFNRSIAGYNLVFDSHKSYLRVSIDSTLRFNFFELNFEPYIPVESKNINANVTKSTYLDIFVDSLAKSYLSNPTTASLSIGVIHNNKINSFYYGTTNKADISSIPNTNSIYEIGSISKIFTAILLAELVENQIISLDDSISKFLPDSLKSNPSLQKITFKQLANHTSGLPRLPDNIEKATNFSGLNPYATYTREDLYAYLKNAQITSEPGDNYEYSNLGYGLLGDLISIITQKSYQQNVLDIISTPLGMTNTIEKINPKTQKLVNTYNSSGKAVPSWDFQNLAGLGALKSNVNDLLRLAQFQFKMPESKLENAMALTRQFTYYLPPNTDVGLGWNMNMSNDVVVYWHNGGTGGSSSFMAIIPDTKSALIILSNSEHSVDEMSMKILEKVLTTK